MAVTPATSRLIDPAVLARFGSLELVARAVVDGVLNGMHRSPDFGFSQEFEEYRAYNEGDDPRHVDWNVYARTDRAFIKRFSGDTNTTLTVVIDSSASMNFASGGLTKFDYARYLAAALFWLARKQRDALALVVFNDAVTDVFPPSTRPDAFQRVLALLQRAECGAKTDMPAAIKQLVPHSQRRGILLFLSDFYTDHATLETALAPLVAHGQEIAFVQVVDPEERAPVLQEVTALRGLESGRQIEVSPEYVSGEYRERFAAHGQAISELAVKTGADYVQAVTSEPVDQLILKYLDYRRRSGAGRR